MSNYCFVHDCHFPVKPCPMCAKFYTDRSPSPAQPLAADTSPPSRTSNAASENGAASLLAMINRSVQASEEFPDGLLVTFFRSDVMLISAFLRQCLDAEKTRCVDAPLPEPAIRAAVYDCSPSICRCGRCCPPGFSPLSDVIARSEKIPSRKAALDKARKVKIAVDPFQGLGKTWSEK